ncbi:MAG: glucose-6-phosphate dehydrogenase assembly protein OpcA [Verrucomicrobia bacterium]|nr:glucose-6-phosphate dehydrogenase assembly protein OpcA [Verrucomicrobiota bacterium]
MTATIENELERIWDSLEGSNKIRASLFNLIFFTKKTGRASYIKTISQTVIQKFPSRVILITLDTDKGAEYLKSNVSVQPIGDEGTVCDFIEIEVAGNYQDRVPFVILPNILPDLPIYVIWAEDPSLSSNLFTELKQLATRMIFDSEGAEHLSQFAKTLIDLETKYKFDVADLNWARTENWRKLLTSTFYPQENFAHLQNCNQIEIVYNSAAPPFPTHTQVQALLLQGWITSQLNWKLEKINSDGRKTSLNYQSQTGKVLINLYQEQHHDLKGGAILSVDIHTADQCHFSFGRDLATPHRVHLRFSTLEKCDIPLQYLFPKDEAGQSLVKEICHRGTSSHYLRLLKQIKEHKEYA